MSRSTISTFQLFAAFPDEETARTYLEGRLWADGVKCPECKGKERITERKNGYYRCNPCRLDFTIRTGTIFERSHVPLHKWVYAMYLVVTSRKGISSLQLSRRLAHSEVGMVRPASAPRGLRNQTGVFKARRDENPRPDYGCRQLPWLVARDGQADEIKARHIGPKVKGEGCIPQSSSGYSSVNNNKQV